MRFEGYSTRKASGPEQGESVRPPVHLLVGDGALLDVDVLAYPEDTFLIMDPYSEIGEVKESFGELMAKAEANLPRVAGEVLLNRRTDHVAAGCLALMVLFNLDFDPPLGEAALMESGENLARTLSEMGPESLCFDRFEMLTRWLSEAKIMKGLLGPLAGLKSLTRVYFNLKNVVQAKRFRMAHDNLFGDARWHPSREDI